MLTTPHDNAWLDLVADLVAQPLTAWPAEEVVELLAGTFDAPAGSYYGQDGDVIEQRPWPADLGGVDRAEIERWTIEQAPREHPLLRWYLASGDPRAMQVADVPTTVASVGLQDQWRSLCHEYLGGALLADGPAAVPGPDGEPHVPDRARGRLHRAGGGPRRVASSGCSRAWTARSRATPGGCTWWVRARSRRRARAG